MTNWQTGVLRHNLHGCIREANIQFTWLDFKTFQEALKILPVILMQIPSCLKQSYSPFSNVMCSYVSLLHILHVHTGKCVLYLKTSNSYNQSHSSHVDYKLNYN